MSICKKKKTIFIVLDGLDYSYIIENINRFTLFKSLFYEGKLHPLKSVIPADSIPSWTSIYTGMNPAEHGVIESIDYLNFKRKVKGDYSVIKGRTFWDILGKQNKKVLVFNPFMAYPAWDVNGIMISGPVFEDGNISTNAPDIVNIDELPPLGGLVDHPNKNTMYEFLEHNLNLTQRQFDSFEKYLNIDDFDFAFLGILTSDRIQHFLWKYTDYKDRCYIKDNKLQDSIFKMYELIEYNIDHIIKVYGEQYNIVAISDHGHGRRCQKTFYVNQWLINKGIINDKDIKKRTIEFLKNFTLENLAKLGYVQQGTSILKKFKFAHKVKNADYVFKDKDKDRVYVPKFDGTNPFGGIKVNREMFNSNQEYEQMRQKIIDGLLELKDDNKSVMIWAKRREDIYSGDNVENYPEIVYLMDSDYGVDRGLYGRKLFGINAMHEVISGGHKIDGIILGNCENIKEVNSVLDIHNYIVEILFKKR